MKIKKFNEYHKINEVSGGYMGPLGRFGIPGVKDIKDILKGTTLRTILSYEPPKRIAVSSPEKNILEKKRNIIYKSYEYFRYNIWFIKSNKEGRY